MTRPVPQIAMAFLRGAEAVRTKAYLDSGGVWTIGVGHTGPEVKKGLVWTSDQVDAQLRRDAEEAAHLVERDAGAAVVAKLSDHQYAALISFTLNLGSEPGWTIWKMLKAGRLDQVPAQLRRFVNDNHKRVQGLANRREAEIVLWNTADVQAAHAVANAPVAAAEAPRPSSILRDEPTPPTPEPAPPATDTGIAAKAGTVVAGVATGAATLQQMVAPHADQAEVLQRVVAVLAMIIVACGVIGLGISWWQHHQRHA